MKAQKVGCMEGRNVYNFTRDGGGVAHGLKKETRRGWGGPSRPLGEFQGWGVEIAFSTPPGEVLIATWSRVTSENGG